MESEATKNLTVRAIKLTSDDPCNKTIEELSLDLNASRDCRKFEVRCHAGDAGHLEVASDSVSVRVGQRIRRDGKQELWGSLLVECKEQDDGSLAVEVVVFHPDWDEPVRIASLQSRPCGQSRAEAALRCDLEHKQV